MYPTSRIKIISIVRSNDFAELQHAQATNGQDYYRLLLRGYGVKTFWMDETDKAIETFHNDSAFMKSSARLA